MLLYSTLHWREETDFCSTIYKKVHSHWQHKFSCVVSESTTAIRDKNCSTFHWKFTQLTFFDVFIQRERKLKNSAISDLSEKPMYVSEGQSVACWIKNYFGCHSKCISSFKLFIYIYIYMNLTLQALPWFPALEFTIIRHFNRIYKTFQHKGLLLQT